VTETTEDFLLGGRVRLEQPAVGLRAAIDAVLLAAAIPARAPEAVLELGCGTGAALLCLAARLPGLALHDVGINRVRG
jgi:tRNA1(Val) A37 N6-methylase TrmN6